MPSASAGGKGPVAPPGQVKKSVGGVNNNRVRVTKQHVDVVVNGPVSNKLRVTKQHADVVVSGPVNARLRLTQQFVDVVIMVAPAAKPRSFAAVI